MSRSYRTAEEKFNIIMESFQNPEISIAELCRNHGIAISLFYKWNDQFIEGGKNGRIYTRPKKVYPLYSYI